MAGSLQLRIRQIRRMVSDLGCWRVRASTKVDGWTCDDAPLATGEVWAREPRPHMIACPSVEVPQSWPTHECRLEILRGGQGRLRLRSEDGRSLVHPVGERHPTFRLPALVCDAEARIAPVSGGSELLAVGSTWRALLEPGERSI